MTDDPFIHEYGKSAFDLGVKRERERIVADLYEYADGFTDSANSRLAVRAAARRIKRGAHEALPEEDA